MYAVFGENAHAVKRVDDGDIYFKSDAEQLVAEMQIIYPDWFFYIKRLDTR